MIIAIDIDNTINNLAEVVVNQYNRDSGDNLSLNDITQYHIENFVREELENKISDYHLAYMKNIYGGIFVLSKNEINKELIETISSFLLNIVLIKLFIFSFIFYN